MCKQDKTKQAYCSGVYDMVNYSYKEPVDNIGD